RGLPAGGRRGGAGRHGHRRERRHPFLPQRERTGIVPARGLRYAAAAGPSGPRGGRLMRILIAALLGGGVTFFWGFVAHVVLPVGEMGMVVASDAAQDQVAAAMKSGFPGEGVYMVPGMDPKLMNDEAAMKAFGARATAMPYAFVVYQPVGKDVANNMGPNLGIQFVTDTLG